jgi:Uma2 family endonuclease
MTVTPTALLHYQYEKWAEEYLKSLPLEHHMEAEAQATQRKITLASLEVVHGRRPEIQVFNEMLVQYPKKGQQRPGQVVPDNMVVVHPTKLKVGTSYKLPWQPAGPFWTLEYVSKGSERKDYEENHRLYERELRVPYYLAFYPDVQELTLFRLSGRRYQSVKPNGLGRCDVSELEIEVAILDGWTRFWFCGDLVPLPADLDRDLAESRLREREQRERADRESQRADALAKQVEEMARELAELRGNGKKKK